MAGAKIQKLIKLLNESIPEHRGRAIIWSADELYPARGAWRKKSMDVWCWQAYAQDAEYGGAALHVGSYATVTDLIKYKRLELVGGDEVYGVEEPKHEPSV